jgi:anti-anti-sigma factor
VADSYEIGHQRAAEGTPTVLYLIGELDINARDDLRDAILTALGDGDVVLDLAGVTFLDSEALGSLIEGYTEAVARGAGYRAVNAHGMAGRVLTVSGARDLFGS